MKGTSPLERLSIRDYKLLGGESSARNKEGKRGSEGKNNGRRVRKAGREKGLRKQRGEEKGYREFFWRKEKARKGKPKRS